MGRHSEYSDEYIEALRDFYIENPITVNELARMTGEGAFPHRISPDKLKWYAMQGRWSVLKQRALHGKTGLPDSIEEEIADLREQVFDAIMDVEDPPGPRDLSTMVQAYMNLQAAGRIKGSSAKVPIQDAITLLEEIDAARANGSDDQQG